MQVVVDKKSDFARATGKKGVTVNGVNYKRFVGTTGGLKIILFSSAIHNILMN